MSPEDVLAAQLVYDDMTERMTDLSFGYFKRTTEDFIGKTLFPSEAQELWTLVSTPDA